MIAYPPLSVTVFLLCSLLLSFGSHSALQAQYRLPPVDTLLYQLEHPVNDSLTFLTLVFLTEQMQFQNPRQGLRYAQQALAMPIAEGDTSRQIEILSRQGACYSRLGIYDSAKMIHQQAYVMGLASGERLHAANQLANISNAFDAQSQLDSALFYNDQALAIYTELKRPIYEAIAYNNQAIISEKQGNYAKAIESYLEALTIFDKRDYKAGSAAVLANLGIIYLRQEAYPEAIDYCQRSLTLKREIEDVFGISINLNTLGEIYLALDQCDSALHYSLEALIIKQKLEDPQGQAAVHTQLGVIYFADQAFREAEHHLNQGYEFAVLAQDQLIQGKAALMMAQLLPITQPKKAVEPYLEEALAIARTTGGRELLREVYAAYYQYYRARKDFRAFDYQDRYQTLSDSLRNDSIVQAFTRQEMEYSFALEKNEIALAQSQKELAFDQAIKRQQLIGLFALLGALALGIISLLLWRSYRLKQKTNQQLNAQNETIQQSLEEREILLKEIHHRVKNNLQIISSLLGLQSRSIDDPLALEAIAESRNRVHSMALIHQNLYQDESLMEVSLPDYISQLTQSLLESYQLNTQEIELKQNIEELSLDVDLLIPLGLILNELISNALKHAFGERQHGQIAIEIQSLPEHLQVKVADNGQGLPPDFEQKAQRSLGYKLVRSFVKKMNASLQINTQAGTQIDMLIPHT
ncbi:MAG: histidine kinase dimerization/phosphoacceptor domain -containing protein [Bacteroidota bacterium]